GQAMHDLPDEQPPKRAVLRTVQQSPRPKGRVSPRTSTVTTRRPCSCSCARYWSSAVSSTRQQPNCTKQVLAPPSKHSPRTASTAHKHEPANRFPRRGTVRRNVAFGERSTIAAPLPAPALPRFPPFS